MKEQADRPAKKRASKRPKEQAKANPVQTEHTVKIQLQSLALGICSAQDWADVEELWRGL